MKKESSDREIAELLGKLREESEKVDTSSVKEEKKSQKLTDDDVKALLRKYYGDSGDLPQDTPPKFEVDTTVDFEEIEEPADPEVIPIANDQPKPDPQPQPEPKAKPIPTPSKTAEPEAKPIQPPVQQAEPTPKAVLMEDEPSDELSAEDNLDEILYNASGDVVHIDESDEPEDIAIPAATEKSEEGTVNAGHISLDPQTPSVDVRQVDDDIKIAEEPQIPTESNETVIDNELVPINDPTETDFPVIDDDDGESAEWHSPGKRSMPAPRITDESNLKLLVALGFGDKLKDQYGDEYVRDIEAELKKSRERDDDSRKAYGYRGKEYAPDSDVAAIRSAYSHDLKIVILRFIGTLLLALTLMVYENAGIFGMTFPGILNSREFPTSYTLISLQLLVLCAALSYGRLRDGFLCMIGKKSKGDQVLFIAFALSVVYNIAVACAAPSDGVILYNFPIALGFVFGVMAELLDCKREYYTFAFLSDTESGPLYGLVSFTPNGGKKLLSAEQIGFADGFFDNNTVSRTYDSALILTAVPLAAVGAVMAIVAAMLGQPTMRALSAFQAVFAFAAPMSWTLTGAWQCLCLSTQLEKKKTAMIGISLSDETAGTNTVVFNDSEAFDASSTKILGINIFDNEKIYSVLYDINALFAALHSPLSGAVSKAASELGSPDSAELVEAADGYAEALINGKDTVCAGSAEAFAEHGIKVIGTPTSRADGASVMYIAKNGNVCACLSVRYSINDKFKRMVARFRAEGISVKVRTIDPNIDRIMLSELVEAGVAVGVIREPETDVSQKIRATQIVARGNVKSLALPLIKGKRFRRLDSNMKRVRVAQTVFAIIVAAVMTFTVKDAVILPAAAALIQLICLIPGILAYHFTVNK